MENLRTVLCALMRGACDRVWATWQYQTHSGQTPSTFSSRLASRGWSEQLYGRTAMKIRPIRECPQPCRCVQRRSLFVPLC